ncbi:tRNA (N6-threonylcarbamoyladenosine(37)-N6)-methyltransferase TrmO [Belnapia moabensis]|uniref:tRNA (N6-threonylcarbamoyladenosine(37)-N6)-methyltransferase TrmO n=1 Tax=Belnapia moabensis TaxID=365533 RepID=UPI0006934AA6|nr:tRNA (N6-threonylcarbamoyladenosine(37)-N6)-methyltransferase TrmO [Belnapia moabensis]
MPGFTLTSIGHLETPWPSPADCPRNGRLLEPRPLCRAVIAEPYREGLDQLDSFSHLILLYWMHLAEPAPLSITPRFAAGPRGVFATRAPVRPNPIALSVVQFEGFAEPGVLLVRNLDCASGTPLLDIKPYLPTVDAEPAASMGWLDPRSPA